MIIDSHCHLHDPVFSDLRGTLARARAQGVTGIIAVGCDPATNAKTLDVAGHHGDMIWPSLGFHPEWTHLSDVDVEMVERQVGQNSSRIVALGEMGLPWYCLKEASSPAALMVRGSERLHRFLELAARYELPVILHAPHAAAAEAFAMLAQHHVERAVFHWHEAPATVTRRIVDAGHLVSVTPEMAYRQRDREMVEWVPLSSLLVETDSPWPHGGEFEGIPTEPWMASRVVEEIASLKRLPHDEVALQLSSNAYRLLRLPDTRSPLDRKHPGDR